MCMPVKLGVRTYATYVNYLTLGGGALLPPIGVGNWCMRWGEQLATSGGKSLHQLMSTYRKENWTGKLCCVNCTRTMTQCMSLHASDQGFPNRGGEDSPSLKGDGKFFWGGI